MDKETRFWLVMENAQGQSRLYLFEGTPQVLGSDSLEYYDLDIAGVSPEHARIIRDGRIFVLIDLGSLNGTFLNENQVLEPQQVSDGDRIRLGVNTLMVFFSSRDKAEAFLNTQHDGETIKADEQALFESHNTVPLPVPSEPSTLATSSQFNADDFNEPTAESGKTEPLTPVVIDEYPPAEPTATLVPDLFDLDDIDAPLATPQGMPPMTPDEDRDDIFSINIPATPTPPPVSIASIHKEADQPAAPENTPLISTDKDHDDVFSISVPAAVETFDTPVKPPAPDPFAVKQKPVASPENVQKAPIPDPFADLSPSISPPKVPVQPQVIGRVKIITPESPQVVKSRSKERLYDVGRFTLLDPQVKDAIFVQCTGCGALYNKKTFIELDGCARCDHLEAQIVTVPAAGKLSVVGKRTPILPENKPYKVPSTLKAAAPARKPGKKEKPEVTQPVESTTIRGGWIAWVIDNVLRLILIGGAIFGALLAPMLLNRFSAEYEFAWDSTSNNAYNIMIVSSHVFTVLVAVFVFYPPVLKNEFGQPSFKRRIVRILAGVFALFVFNTIWSATVIGFGITRWNAGWGKQFIDFTYNPLTSALIHRELIALGIGFLSAVIYRIFRPRRDLVPRPPKLISFLWFHLWSAITVIIVGIMGVILAMMIWPQEFSSRFYNPLYIPIPIASLRLNIPFMEPHSLIAIAIALLIGLFIYHPPAWSGWTRPLWILRVIVGAFAAFLIYSSYINNEMLYVAAVTLAVAIVALPFHRAAS